jgi:hypothetical protein
MLEAIKGKIILVSYIGQALLALLSVLLLGASLLVGNNYSEGAVASLPYFYVSGAFSIVLVILVSIESALYFVGPIEERSSAKRIKAAMGLRLAFRITMLLLSGTGLLGEYVGGGVAGRKGYDDFLLVFFYLLLVVEGLLFLYTLWKMAWIKENPERFSYGYIGNKKVPTKVEDTSIDNGQNIVNEEKEEPRVSKIPLIGRKKKERKEKKK